MAWSLSVWLFVVYIGTVIARVLVLWYHIDVQFIFNSFQHLSWTEKVSTTRTISMAVAQRICIPCLTLLCSCPTPIDMDLLLVSVKSHCTVSFNTQMRKVDERPCETVT